MRTEASGTTRVLSGEGIFALQERIARASADDPYAQWAREILAEP
jgi:hypothetical protein